MKNVFMTGWQTCCSGFELKPEFGMDEVQCLDASYFVPAGSTGKTDSGTVVAEALFDMVKSRLGLP
jgi:hypothetical protein